MIASSNPGAPYIRSGFEPATDFLRLKTVQMLAGKSVYLLAFKPKFLNKYTFFNSIFHFILFLACKVVSFEVV